MTPKANCNKRIFFLMVFDYFREVNKLNVMKGLSAELQTCDPIHFDRFKEELIQFILETEQISELVEFLPEFQPVKRQKHNIGWNGYLKGAVLLDPEKYADRVIEFADIAFSMVTPWQRVGTKYIVNKEP